MRVPLHTAQVAKALSFALGKRFTVAKLTASLSARAKLRPRLLVASGRLFPSPEIQVSTEKDLLIPRSQAGLEASYLWPMSPPFLLLERKVAPFQIHWGLQNIANSQLPTLISIGLIKPPQSTISLVRINTHLPNCCWLNPCRYVSTYLSVWNPL